MISGRRPQRQGDRRGAGPRAGQALLELALFGAAALAALGFMIRVGMQMNFEQEVRMGAFRRALALAGSDNGTPQDAMAVTYHYILDRQMPNPSDGFMSMPRNRTEASAFVEWGDHLTFAYESDRPGSMAGRRTQPAVVVRSNDNEQIFRHSDFPDHGPGTLTNRGVVKESWTTNSAGAGINQEQRQICDSRGCRQVVGSSLSSGTGTSSRTTLNTRGGDSVGSRTPGGGGSVSW